MILDLSGVQGVAWSAASGTPSLPGVLNQMLGANTLTDRLSVLSCEGGYGLSLGFGLWADGFAWAMHDAVMVL